MPKTTFKNVAGAKKIIYTDLKKIKSALDTTSKDIQHLMAGAYQQSIDDVKNKGLEYKTSLEHYTAKQPLKSLSFAALIGLVLGLRFGR